MGEEGASRGDLTSSEDDNVLVQGVAGDKYALGFFGFAYYDENRERLKVVPIDDEDDSNGSEAIVPSQETVGDGTYQPLSRPVFIYVRAEAAERPEIDRFVEFYLTEGAPLVREVGYIPLQEQTYQLALERFNNRTTGSMLGEGSQVGVSVDDLLMKQQ